MSNISLKSPVTIAAIIGGICFVAYKIFFPQSYAECLNDGKTGRTDNELLIHSSYCAKKFPAFVLPKGNKPFTANCIQSNGPASMTLQFFENSVRSNNDLYYNIELRSEDAITFSAVDVVGNNKKKYNVNASLNLNTGQLTYSATDVVITAFNDQWTFNCTQAQ